MDYSKQTRRFCVVVALIAFAYAYAAKADGDNQAIGGVSKDDIIASLLEKLMENNGQAGNTDNANLGALAGLLGNNIAAKPIAPANPPTVDPNTALLMSLLERLNQNMERAAQQSVPTQSFVQSPVAVNPAPTCARPLIEEMAQIVASLGNFTINSSRSFKRNILGEHSVNKFKYFFGDAVLPRKEWNNGLLNLLETRYGVMKLYEGSGGFEKMLGDARRLIVSTCQKVQEEVSPQVKRLIRCLPQLNREDQYMDALKYLDDNTIEWIQISKLCAATSDLDEKVRAAHHVFVDRIWARDMEKMKDWKPSLYEQAELDKMYAPPSAKEEAAERARRRELWDQVDASGFTLSSSGASAARKTTMAAMGRR